MINQELEKVANIERAFADANPLQVGDRITIHHKGFYHASCTVLKLTDKAVQVSGSPESSSRVYTVWFPLSALDRRSSPCSDGISHSADIKRWFISKMSPSHERLVGALY